VAIIDGGRGNVRRQGIRDGGRRHTYYKQGYPGSGLSLLPPGTTLTDP